MVRIRERIDARAATIYLARCGATALGGLAALPRGARLRATAAVERIRGGVDAVGAAGHADGAAGAAHTRRAHLARGARRTAGAAVGAAGIQVGAAGGAGGQAGQALAAARGAALAAHAGSAAGATMSHILPGIDTAAAVLLRRGTGARGRRALVLAAASDKNQRYQ